MTIASYAPIIIPSAIDGPIINIGATGSAKLITSFYNVKRDPPNSFGAASSVAFIRLLLFKAIAIIQNNLKEIKKGETVHSRTSNFN
jgi:hypothetical protein